LIVKGVPVLISENPPTIYQKIAIILPWQKESRSQTRPTIAIKVPKSIRETEVLRHDKYFEHGNLKLQHVGAKMHSKKFFLVCIF
jgi:hypothetical protein